MVTSSVAAHDVMAAERPEFAALLRRPLYFSRQREQAQHEAMDLLDDVLRRPDLMYATYLRPGDMRMLNNHVTLHSRTAFEDFDDPVKQRCLFRLWLAPPDWPRLPESWRPAYGSVEAGTVRGGILGQAFDDERRAYEARQAAELGMRAAAVAG